MQSCVNEILQFDKKQFSVGEKEKLYCLTNRVGAVYTIKLSKFRYFFSVYLYT